VIEKTLLGVTLLKVLKKNKASSCRVWEFFLKNPAYSFLEDNEIGLQLGAPYGKTILKQWQEHNNKQQFSDRLFF